MVSSPGFSRNLRNNDPEDADIAAQPRFVSGATRSASWRWLMETSRGEFGDRKKKRKEDSSKGIGSIDITQLCVYTDIYTHIIYIYVKIWCCTWEILGARCKDTAWPMKAQESSNP